jgi:spore coat protein U-like protein
MIFFSAVEGRAECWITNVTNVNFGNYDTLSSLNNDSTGSISVFCNAHTWVRTYIGASPNSGGFNPRQMLNSVSGDLLNYNLYRNSSRTEIWGDGTQGTYTMYQRVNRNHTATWTIYGRILPGMDVGIGNYGEVLVVTIEY